MGSLLDAKALAALAPYMTNPAGRVSVLTNVPQIDAGAAFSRLSRSEQDVAHILVSEFMIEDPEVEGGYRFNVEKGEAFYKRVLAEYGDESVAELMGAHVAIARCSNLAAKGLEEHRLASFLEKSSRYIYYDQPDAEGKFLYYRPEEISAHPELGPLYEKTLDALFETYAQLHAPVRAELERRFPRDERVEKKWAWEQTLKAKTADVLRGLLPAATLTNLGIFANARSLEYIISQQKASPLPELREIAAELHLELRKVLTTVLERLDRDSGRQMTEYKQAATNLTQALSQEHGHGLLPQISAPVTLTDYDQDCSVKVVAALLFPEGDVSLAQARATATALTSAQRTEVVQRFADLRTVRQHRPPQAFEMAQFTFEICANFGVYKDLQRHRLMSRPRQNLGLRQGYDTPPLIEEMGLTGQWKQALEAPARLVAALQKEYPHLAEYPVPNAYRLRWYISANLRELVHMLELRTIPQGHQEYREIAQQMASEVMKVAPELAAILKFVNYENADLERRDASNKMAEKLTALGVDLE